MVTTYHHQTGLFDYLIPLAQNSVEHFIGVHSLNPKKKIFYFQQTVVLIFVLPILRSLSTLECLINVDSVISSTNLTPDDVVDDDLDGVGLDVEVDGLLGLLLPVLPSISTPTVFSTGQQMLGTLLVKPQEYSERNFNFSLGDKLSSCCSEISLKVKFDASFAGICKC